MRTSNRVKTKRIYEKSEASDGSRILVDRLWPRGLTKEKARVDLWLKEIGPSDELRKWFGHDAVDGGNSGRGIEMSSRQSPISLSLSRT